MVTPFLESINSGEFSPKMEARVTFGRYPNAAKMLRNCILYPQGGFTRRPGTRYVAGVKTSSDSTKLIPYQHSEDNSYVVETGNGYMRFYWHQGRLDVDDTDAAISNGTFTSNITDWDDRSTSTSYAYINLFVIGNGAAITSIDAFTWGSFYQVNDVVLVTLTVKDGSATTITPPSGWTALYNTVGSGDLRRGATYYHVVTGAESGTVTFSFSTTADSVICLVTNLTNTSGTAPEAGTSATGTSAASDPPSVTPSWGSNTTTWIATSHSITNGVDTGPSGFLLGADLFSTLAALGLAWKWYEGTTIDPGTFALNGSVAWITNTIAVKPKVSAIAHDSSNGRLELPGAALTTTSAEQDVTVGAGNTGNVHVLKFTVEGTRGGEVGVQIGSTSTGTEILTEVLVGVGYHCLEFTPGATTFYVQFRNSTTQDMYIDDVSIIDNAPTEIATPYSASDMDGLKAYQSDETGGVVYLLHADYWPRKLTRRGHRSWSLEEVVFDDGPYLATNGGTDLNANQLISNPLFENGLAGWTDVSAGDGYVEHVDTTQIAEMYPGTSGGSGSAGLYAYTAVSDAAVYVLHVLTAGAGPIDISVGTTSGGTEYVGTTINAGWHSYQIDPISLPLYARFDYDQYGQANAAVAACLLYSQQARLLKPSATTGSATVTAYGFSPFTSDDVGRLLRMTWPGKEPGWGVISAVASSSSATLQIYRALGNTVPTEDWNFGAWGGDQGYPETLGFYDGRAVFAKTTAKQKTLWFSQSGDFENMRPDSFESGGITVEADDAIATTMASAGIDPILWMNGSDNLVVGTASGQFLVTSSGAVVTPTDISVKRNTSIKSSDLAVPVNDITVFVDRSQRRAYDIGYQFNNGKFVATNLTVLADHIFNSKAQEIAYQESPYSIIWVRRADGRLAALSYDKQHEVLGWSQSIIGGTFSSGDAVVESVVTIPGAVDSGQTFNSDNRDEVWMIVKRTVNGSTVRYVEFMEQFYEGPLREDYATEEDWHDAVVASQDDCFYVDSGLTYDGSATATITGLSHLEGETVKVLADGKVVADATVSSGQITLAANASKVQVGLPYTHRYESLKIAVGGADGTAVTKIKMISTIGMVLLDTGSFKATTVEYDPTYGRRLFDLMTIDFPREQDNPTSAEAIFTGETSQEVEGGGSPDPRIYIESDLPLPFTLLGLAPVVQTESASVTRN